MKSRREKFALNTLVPFVSEIVTLICGFILPRLILTTYGSATNGLINSITQFLSVITLLDLGMGAVVSSALYGPLAGKDNNEISRIYVSARKFCRMIALILAFYVVCLICVYPYIINQEYGFIFTGTLILAISINSFSQYYFGYVNGILLSADQRAYVRYASITLTQIINLVVSVFLIHCGVTIQILKLSTSLIYLIRPAVFAMYVGCHYNIDKKIKYTVEPIKQKWNGIAQHIAYYVLTSTDSIVLTVFSTLENVSIYAVYNLVIANIKALFSSLICGMQPLIGDMLAKNETKKLHDFFGFTEWLFHAGVTLIYGCVGSLLVAFVTVYTKGVTDADYAQPLFAFLITLACAGDYLKQPYNWLVLAAGHYKQTQHIYIIAAIINIMTSIFAVRLFGLTGVALGTILAMLYQTTSLAWYNSKAIIFWSFGSFVKQVGVDFLCVIAAAILVGKLKLRSITYGAWIILAVKVFLIWLFIVAVINLLFYRDKMLMMRDTAKCYAVKIWKKVGK